MRFSTVSRFLGIYFLSFGRDTTGLSEGVKEFATYRETLEQLCNVFLLEKPSWGATF